MKFLVLVLSIAAAVYARPDVSHLSGGYHYKPPTTSYGEPIVPRYDSTDKHHHVSEVPTGSYLPSHLQTPYPNNPINFLSGSKDNIYGYNPHLIQDQKHVYYYAAPDEEEPTRLRIHIAPNNQKNTNVIFVKAPTYRHVIPEVIAPPSQAEERTKVFVLVKKPEEPAAISIAAPTPSKSKPEVYVVKYKDQHEAEQLLSGGRGGQPLGAHVHHVGDEGSFLKVLQNDANIHRPQNDKYSGFDGNLNVFGARFNPGQEQTYNVNLQSGNVGGSSGLQGNFAKDGSTGSSSNEGGFTGGVFKYTSSSPSTGGSGFTSNYNQGILNGNSGNGGDFKFTTASSPSTGGSSDFSVFNTGSNQNVAPGSGNNGNEGVFRFTSPSSSGSADFSAFGTRSNQEGTSGVSGISAGNTGSEGVFKYTSSSAPSSGGTVEISVVGTGSNQGSNQGISGNEGGFRFSTSSPATGSSIESGSINLSGIGSGSSGGAHVTSSLDSLNAVGNNGNSNLNITNINGTAAVVFKSNFAKHAGRSTAKVNKMESQDEISSSAFDFNNINSKGGKLFKSPLLTSVITASIKNETSSITNSDLNSRAAPFGVSERTLNSSLLRYQAGSSSKSDVDFSTLKNSADEGRAFAASFPESIANGSSVSDSGLSSFVSRLNTGETEKTSSSVGSSSGSFGFTSSSSDSGSSDLAARFDKNADSASGSSLTGSITSSKGFSSYGPPGTSGPY